MNATAELLDIQQYRKPQIQTGSSDVLEFREPITLPSHVPLFESKIGGEERKLNRPIRLKVREEEALIFVENETLDIFGHGSNLPEAIAEFRRDLEYYWNYYSRLREDEVSGHGARLKETYASLFE